MISLNDKQKLAAETLDGPVLVLAGPGTGKTELLSVRAANIIKAKKASPENILILTYTNAAAKAMKERLVKILGPAAYNVEACTFHSFANSVILESVEAADYVGERIQISDAERMRLIEYILDNTDGIDDIRPFKAPYHYEKAILSKITELKRDGITPEAFEKAAAKAKPDGSYIEDKHIPKIKALAKVYKLYEEYKSGKNKDLFDERGRYDYEDMIIFAVQALRDSKGLRDALRAQYTYIMVDEYQDTNGAQMDLLFELADGKEPNLCCVGDDDQSIYRFQGASVGNFKILKEKFPGIKEIPLDSNYRSTKEIISLTDKVIRCLPEKERVFIKELIPKRDYEHKDIEFYEFTRETEELVFIVNKIKDLKKIIEKAPELPEDDRKAPYNQIAVLVRKRADVLKLVDAFLKAGIPYATDGKEDIAGEKRVRQMLDVLRFAHMKDPADTDTKDALLYRILTSDYMRIPFEDVLRFAGSCRKKSLFMEFMNSGDSPFKAAHKALKDLLSEAETRPVHAILMQYIKEAGIFKFILETYRKDDLLRIRDLRALTAFVNMVKEADIAKPATTLAEFIDELDMKETHGMALEGELVTATQEGVRIFTAHGAKGLEFHTVFIPFCLQDKNWPSRPQADLIPLPPEVFKGRQRITDKQLLKQLDLHDETRLFYVASTRAKAHLIYTASPTDSSVSSSFILNTGLKESSVSGKEEAVLSDFLTQSDAKDPFIGTEKVLKDLVQNLTLNPTALNNYITCRRKYLYDDVLMLPGEKTISLTFGNCVHKALEEAYSRFMKAGKFPDFAFFKEAFKQELLAEGTEKKIETACLRKIDDVKKWFDIESKAPLKPLGLEKKLLITLEDDLTFTGKYDKTEPCGPAKDKCVRVVDYKTGAPDEHVKRINNCLKDGAPLGSDECDGYLRQLVAYKVLFEGEKREFKGYNVSEGKLVFVEPAKKTIPKHDLKVGDFRNLTVELTDDMAAELKEIIKECWRGIKALKFEKLPERSNEIEKCAGCPYDDICWG